LYLVYTDETGTNFSEKSPYLLYGGLIVHESKVDSIEIQLEQIIAKFLKLDDIRKVELHTSEIFSILFFNADCKKKRKKKDKAICESLKELLKDVTVDDFIDFTNEIIQFLTKMNILLVVGVVNKNDELHYKHRLNKEVSAIAYSFKLFLNLIDRFMATRNEKALLIADDFINQISPKINLLSLHERVKDENLKTPNGARKELVLLRVLYESMNWKYNITDGLEDIAPLKYKFESKNFFIIDNINYTNSKDSILNQITDFMLFVIRKTIEFNNSKKINNKNLEKFTKQIESSLHLSIHESCLIFAKIQNGDISQIGFELAILKNYENICSEFK